MLLSKAIYIRIQGILYQFMHSLGVEPMTLALLIYCLSYRNAISKFVEFDEIWINFAKKKKINIQPFNITV